eukprot:2988066-Amphidinium_carterae.2
MHYALLCESSLAHHGVVNQMAMSCFKRERCPGSGFNACMIITSASALHQYAAARPQATNLVEVSCTITRPSSIEDLSLLKQSRLLTPPPCTRSKLTSRDYLAHIGIFVSRRLHLVPPARPC